MRDADETIERLMAGLRDAEPSAGMRRRILEAMEVHQAASPDSLWHRLITPWLLRPSVSTSLLCAATLAASLIAAIKVHQPLHAPADARNHSMHANAAPGTRPETVAKKVPIEPQRTASRLPARHPPGGDVSAARETQTASYPAPPLPLTDQERLLLRVVHRNDPENRALLNPDLQAAQSARATEQFQQFFAINAEEMRNESE